MTKGYVYILSNESLPGLIKIGKTTRTVEQRANELFTSGLPTPFKIEHEILTPNCHELEDVVHHHFCDWRVSPDREFFKLCPIDAFDKINEFMLDQLREILLEYSECHSIVEEFMVMDEEDFSFISDTSGIGHYELMDCFIHLKPEHLREARERRDEAKLKSKREKTKMPNGAVTELKAV